VSTVDADSSFPEVLAPVTLQLELDDGARAELSSRVCDLEEIDGVTRIVVSRPELSSLAEPGTFPREGEEPMVLWPLAAGAMQCHVAAEAAIREYGPVWVLTPLGEPSREQRREFFRTPLSLPAVLTPVVDGVAADDDAVQAHLVDLSEGGAVICCDAALPDVDAPVRLSFTMEENTVVVEGEVLRHAALPTGRPTAAVRFSDPTRHGDDIRRFTFGVQRAQARTRSD
jgi:hypothetical protein